MVDQVFDKLREIIAVELQVDPGIILPTSSLREDLGMDSIAALNILFAAQTEFGLDNLGERDLPMLRTVADAEEMIRHHLDTSCRS